MVPCKIPDRQNPAIEIGAKDILFVTKVQRNSRKFI